MQKECHFFREGFLMDDIEIESQKLFDESFSINSDEASSILGVSKTRLSQLTQKGQFSYERKKVGTRSRIFYKLSDLLDYQRHQGVFHASQDSREPSYRPGASRYLESTLEDKADESFQSVLGDDIRSRMETLLSHSLSAFQSKLTSLKSSLTQRHSQGLSASEIKKEESFQNNIQVIIGKLDSLSFEFEGFKKEFERYFDILKNLSFHIARLDKKESENSRVLRQCKHDLNFIKSSLLEENLSVPSKRKKIFFSKKKRRKVQKNLVS